MVRLNVFFFLGYIILGLCVGYFGRTRAIGFWGWFFCSIVFTPLPCIVILLITKPRKIRTT